MLLLLVSGRSTVCSNLLFLERWVSVNPGFSVDALSGIVAYGMSRLGEPIGVWVGTFCVSTTCAFPFFLQQQQAMMMMMRRRTPAPMAA